jgi:hypothetical protein
MSLPGKKRSRSVNWYQDPSLKICPYDHIWDPKKYPRCLVCQQRFNKAYLNRVKAGAKIAFKTPGKPSATVSRLRWNFRAKEAMQLFLDCWKRDEQGAWKIRQDMWPQMLEVRDLMQMIKNTELKMSHSPNKKRQKKQEQESV